GECGPGAHVGKRAAEAPVVGKVCVRRDGHGGVPGAVGDENLLGGVPDLLDLADVAARDVVFGAGVAFADSGALAVAPGGIAEVHEGGRRVVGVHGVGDELRFRPGPWEGDDVVFRAFECAAAGQFGEAIEAVGG